MHTRAYIIELPKQRPEKSVVFEFLVFKRREAVKRTRYIKILYAPHYTSRHYTYCGRCTQLNYKLVHFHRMIRNYYNFFGRYTLR